MCCFSFWWKVPKGYMAGLQNQILFLQEQLKGIIIILKPAILHHLQNMAIPHAGSGWRIHCGVEVTELSTNKHQSLSVTSTELLAESRSVVLIFLNSSHRHPVFQTSQNCLCLSQLPSLPLSPFHLHSLGLGYPGTKSERERERERERDLY